MRNPCAFILAGCLAASAQQTTTFSTDLNGRRMVDGVFSTSTSGNATTRTELTQSVNGRMVPAESVEERVISDDANGRVVERIVRKFDANGNPGMSEKRQIREKKNPDGTLSSVETVYRSDMNGRYALAEKVTTQASKAGAATTANIVVERPSMNGSLETVEKQSRIQTGDDKASKTDTTTFRKDPNGSFMQMVRVVSDSTTQDGQRVENIAQYEPADDGKMKLSLQSVARSRRNPDGTESKEVDYYRNVPGRAEPSATPRLLERQVIEQRRSGDQLVETKTVLRPTINDPNHLGAPVKLGERICTGKDCR